MSAAYNCDNCKQFRSSEAPIRLHGQFYTKRAGILLPHSDWDFCSLKCFDAWFRDIVGLQRETFVEPSAGEQARREASHGVA